jgi:hypothetical protein
MANRLLLLVCVVATLAAHAGYVLSVPMPQFENLGTTVEVRQPSFTVVLPSPPPPPLGMSRDLIAVCSLLQPQSF